MTGRSRQLLLGVVGGVVGVVLCRWGGYYLPETDSFVELRDVPGIVLALFVGTVPALIAGGMAAIGRAAIGLFGGMGSATWVGSSLATFVATLVAVAARRWIFRGGRPSFALGAAVAAIAEMMHMATVLLVGFADFSVAFAVIVAAIPFQCGGTAALVAVTSLATNRRQDGRENLSVAALMVTVVTFVTLVYFAMGHQAEEMACGLLPMTENLYKYPCHLATVLYGIVLAILIFIFAVYAKRIAPAAPAASVRPGGATAGRVRIGLRGRFAISLAAMLCVIGGLVGWIVAVDSRAKYEGGYAETALFVADSLSRFLDGERVRGYLETSRKDDYYHEIMRLMKSIRADSEILYFFVGALDGQDVVYVWDTGEGDLGVRDCEFEADEIRTYRNIFQQRIDRGCFVHRSQAYGYLMSAVTPIPGADGRPVAFVEVDISMDYIDQRITQLVFSFILLTLSLVLVSLVGYYFFVSRFIVSPAERQIQSEKDRIYAELNVARKIQADALPSVFPAFPDRPEFDVYAMMIPAKEVGGDFYDFFLVDATHLALVIGDVSDKGVPAALFMMTTKTLIKARTRQGGTPGAILRDVNDQLCEGNQSGMFVTVYLAIIDLATGRGLAANAGHEHPILRRAGGDFEHVRYRHDPMLAMAPGLRYTDRAFELHPGDTLLVYTDGVTECATAARAFYGTDRITAFLNGRKEQPLESLLKSLRADLTAFAGIAPQSDDITLLAMTLTNCGHSPEVDLSSHHASGAGKVREGEDSGSSKL